MPSVVESEEVEDVIDYLTNFDIDNPYLDEVEQEIADQSQLEFVEAQSIMNDI